MENLITIEAKSYGIEEQKANELIGNLPQIQSERSVLQEQYNEVIKLDIEEANTSKIAKELRLKIVKNRTQGIGVWHKTTKDFFLKGGQFVDAIKRKEEAVNIQMEETLEAIEKHAENKEKERLYKLQVDRLELISPYLENTFGLDLAVMSEEMFENFLIGSKQKHEAKIEAERLESERIENERKLDELARERQLQIAPYIQFINTPLELRLMSDEDYKKLVSDCQIAKNDFDKKQEEIRLDNERLKKEAEEKEKALELYRKAQAEKEAKLKEEAEAKLKAEREAKEKLEAEIKSKAEADAKAKADAEKEAKKLAKAPIKKQLTIWVDSFKLPNTNVDNETSKAIVEKFEAFKKWSQSQIDNI